MKKMIISIHGLNDVYKFVEQALAVDGDVTVMRGRHSVDGKSVLGVFSIDMSQNVTVEYPETALEFENFISQFKIK